MSAAAASRAPRLALMAWCGYVSGVNGAVAPSLAHSFGLSDAALARALAWAGLSAFVALALGRRADRLGRRTVLRTCAIAAPFGAAACAAARGLGGYVAAQVLVQAFAGTLVALVVVVTAEEHAADRRAREHAHAGLVFTLGTSLPLLVAVALADQPDSWRWVWLVAAVGGVTLPRWAAGVPETRPWREALGAATPPPRLLALLAPARRRHALAIGTAAVCVAALEAATRTWLYHHALRTLGVDPGTILAILVLGGAVGLAGFPLGGWLADRLGRRRAFVSAALLFVAGAAGYYGGGLLSRDAPSPVLAVSFLLLALGGNAALPAFRAVATELFPTSLRGLVAGWLAVASAAGWLVAMLGVALLAGGLGSAGLSVCALLALAVPACALVLGLPETRYTGLDGEPELARAGAGGS